MLAANRGITFAYSNSSAIICSCRKLACTVRLRSDILECGREEPKEKRKNDTLYLFGPSSCYSALLNGRRELTELYLNEGLLNGPPLTHVSKLITEAERRSIPISYRKEDFLNKCMRFKTRTSGISSHNDVVLKCGKLGTSELDTEDLAPKENDKIWLALDQVQDPMNLGAIIRTCSYYGVSRVVISKSSCSLSPVVSFESSGAAEWFPIYSVPSMEDFISQSSASGWNTLASVGPEAEKFDKPLHLVDSFLLEKPSILVVGSEPYGLTDKVVRSCSHIITINSYRNNLPWGLDSLNVSIATGVMLHLLLGNSRSDLKREHNIMRR